MQVFTGIYICVYPFTIRLHHHPHHLNVALPLPFYTHHHFTKKKTRKKSLASLQVHSTYIYIHTQADWRVIMYTVIECSEVFNGEFLQELLCSTTNVCIDILFIQVFHFPQTSVLLKKKKKKCGCLMLLDYPGGSEFFQRR